MFNGNESTVCLFNGVTAEVRHDMNALKELVKNNAIEYSGDVERTVLYQEDSATPQTAMLKNMVQMLREGDMITGSCAVTWWFALPDTTIHVKRNACIEQMLEETLDEFTEVSILGTGDLRIVKRYPSTNVPEFVAYIAYPSRDGVGWYRGFEVSDTRFSYRDDEDYITTMLGYIPEFTTTVGSVVSQNDRHRFIPIMHTDKQEEVK